MFCPKCDERSYCLETRQYVKSVRQRRYRCSACANIFVTQESPVKSWVSQKELERKEKRRARREAND